MYKVLNFVKRKDHLTHEQFREHFERSHAAMAIKFYGHLFTDYRRHYFKTKLAGGDPRANDGSFHEQPTQWDLLSEWTMASEDDWDEVQRLMVESEHQHLFLEDEDRFIDRKYIVMVPCTASYNTGTVFNPEQTVFDTPTGQPSWEGYEAWMPLDR
jgi:hypothetical protein